MTARLTISFKKQLTSIKRHLIDSWWVFFFALLCFFCYEQGVKVWNVQFKTLSKRLDDLRTDKEVALRLQDELSSQIESQNEVEWIELTLMNKLGLVPEGQKKVYFTK
jgi:hypothetical protein